MRFGWINHRAWILRALDCGAIVIALLHCTTKAIATDRHWSVGSGLWSQSVNWTPGAVPGPSDNAIVDFFSNGTGGLARITTSSIGAVTSVSVLNGSSVRITNLGSLLCGTDFIVARSNTHGSLDVQTTNPLLTFPGGLTIGANLRIGVLSGIGQVNQNDGTIAVGNHVIIGESSDSSSQFSGVGTYNLSGLGTLRTATIDVGYSPGDAGTREASGTFNVSGFSTVNVGTLGVGRITGITAPGVGCVNQSGGQMNVANELTIGFSRASKSGSYNLSGGTLNSALTNINSGGTFTFAGGAMSAGVLDIEGQLKLTSGANKIVRARELFFETETGTQGGVLDLSDNSMIVTFATPEDIRFLIGKGYNGGTWTGPRITSSAAALTTNHALGYGLTPQNELIVKYTLYGDADLNGVVNFDDYARIDHGFNNAGSIWSEGDFDYNGVVNFDDYSLIDLAFNTQGGARQQPVPEPTSVAVTFVASIIMLSRASARRCRSKCA